MARLIERPDRAPGHAGRAGSARARPGWPWRRWASRLRRPVRRGRGARPRWSTVTGPGAGADCRRPGRGRRPDRDALAARGAGRDVRRPGLAADPGQPAGAGASRSPASWGNLPAQQPAGWRSWPPAARCCGYGLATGMSGAGHRCRCQPALSTYRWQSCDPGLAVGLFADRAQGGALPTSPSPAANAAADGQGSSPGRLEGLPLAIGPGRGPQPAAARAGRGCWTGWPGGAGCARLPGPWWTCPGSPACSIQRATVEWSRGALLTADRAVACSEDQPPCSSAAGPLQAVAQVAQVDRGPRAGAVRAAGLPEPHAQRQQPGRIPDPDAGDRHTESWSPGGSAARAGAGRWIKRRHARLLPGPGPGTRTGRCAARLPGQVAGAAWTPNPSKPRIAAVGLGIWPRTRSRSPHLVSGSCGRSGRLRDHEREAWSCGPTQLLPHGGRAGPAAPGRTWCGRPP